ncbi:PepSY domain-containing protein [Nonomuraea glycinis]|uniref:PepSY domain-containing protein n=1 Tax=Nonomuraea glycinis TaxID=2047744 RepID=UPI002E13785B|nr:PepSY domain-containing protein [Nonomuraea glycinis]
MHITTKIIVASAGVMALVAGGSAALAAADQPAPKVAVEQAVQIAQKEVPGAWVREVGFDKRGTRPDVWEVELIKGDIEHELDIDAATGKLLKKESERVDSDDDDTAAGQNSQSTQNSDDSDDSRDDD